MYSYVHSRPPFILSTGLTTATNFNRFSKHTPTGAQIDLSIASHKKAKPTPKQTNPDH
jgi:hypothetical protein